MKVESGDAPGGAADSSSISVLEREVSTTERRVERTSTRLVADLMAAGAAASQRSEDRFAAALFNEAIARAPDSFEAYLLRGVNHARNGRNSSALTDAEVALYLCPDNGPAYELKASALRGLGREDEAMATLDEAVEALPKSPGVRVMRGAGNLRLGAHREAVRDLDEAVKCGAGAIAYILRGEARLGLDAYASAQKDFETVLAFEPEHPRALGGLVQSLSRRKRWADQIAASTSLLELFGPDPEVLAHRAHARLEMGRTFMALLDGVAALSVRDHKQARRWTDSAVARLSSEPETGAQELVLVLENCDLLEANGVDSAEYLDEIESFSRVETYAVTMARAIRARDLESPRQVVRLAERAAKLAGATCDTDFVIAGALLDDGDFAGARRVAASLIESGEVGALGWNLGDARLIAAAAAEEESGAEAALELLECAEPTHRVVREIGRLYAALGDEEPARMALRRAFELDASDPTTAFENARFEMAYDTDTALDFLAHLVDIAPHFGWAITGESAFDPLRSTERFQELVQEASTVAAGVRLTCDLESIRAFAAERGWVWRWLGRKTLATQRLVSWELPDLDASAFFMDDAVSDVRALVFYGNDAARAARETADSLEGSLQLSVREASADPLEALAQLRLSGWALSQGLSSQASFDALVLDCLEHHDSHLRWRASSAAILAEDPAVDAKLEELAKHATDDRVGHEARYTLGLCEASQLAVNHHERWEIYQIDAARDVVERVFWEAGLTFVGEHEPDRRSSYETTWASPDGELAASYVEDERHGVTLVSFAGEADELVRHVGLVGELRSLEDALAVAQAEPNVESVRAIGALIPEAPVDMLQGFVAELLDGPDDELRRAARQYLAGTRDWLPDAAGPVVEAKPSRYVLSPLVTPLDVGQYAATNGWEWVDAEPTSDRDHPSPHVRWRRGDERLELNLHRFGFWLVDLYEADASTVESVAESFEIVDVEALVERANHPDSSVRAEAVHQLGSQAECDPTASIVETLRVCLTDESLEVRTHALEATCIAAKIESLKDDIAKRVDQEPDNDLRDYAAVLLDAMD